MYHRYHRAADRLLNQLRVLDVGRLEDPRFGRGLDFVQPDDRALFRFERDGPNLFGGKQVEQERQVGRVRIRIFTKLPDRANSQAQLRV